MMARLWLRDRRDQASQEKEDQSSEGTASLEGEEKDEHLGFNGGFNPKCDVPGIRM